MNPLRRIDNSSFFSYPVIFITLAFISVVLFLVGYFELRAIQLVTKPSAILLNIVPDIQIEPEPIIIYHSIPIYSEPVEIDQSLAEIEFNLSELPTIAKPDPSKLMPSPKKVFLSPLKALKADIFADVKEMICSWSFGFSEIDPETGYTLLHYLLKTNNAKLVECFFESDSFDYGTVLNRQSLSGDTPLHLAVSHLNSELAYYFSKILYEDMKADADIKNLDGLTPIDLAKSRKNQNIAKLFNKIKF